MLKIQRASRDLTRLAATAAFLIATPALAHGEKIVEQELSWLGLLLGGLFVLFLWRASWRLKLALYGILVAGITAIIFVPEVESVGDDLFGYSRASTIVFSVGFPLLVCGIAFLILRRRFDQNSSSRRPS